MRLFLIITILSVGIMRAQDRPDRALKASVVAVIAGTAADAYSSWHRPELNPVLANGRGEFGMKGISIKAAVTGGILLFEFTKRHDRSWRKSALIVNWTSAGIYGAAAARNEAVK